MTKEKATVPTINEIENEMKTIRQRKLKEKKQLSLMDTMETINEMSFSFLDKNSEMTGNHTPEELEILAKCISSNVLLTVYVDRCYKNGKEFNLDEVIDKYIEKNKLKLEELKKQGKSELFIDTLLSYEAMTICLATLLKEHNTDNLNGKVMLDELNKGDKNTRTQAFKETLELAPYELNSYIHTPSTNLTHLVKTAICYFGTNWDIRGNKDVKIKTSKNRYGKTEINCKSRNTDISISIENYNVIANKQDPTTRKVFSFLLQKSNEQNHSPEINFSLKELVDLGIYKCMDTARRGLKTSFSKIMKIMCEGEIKSGKKTLRNTQGYLFYNINIEENFCTVSRNDKFNIEFIAQYITILPKWIYKLGTKTGDNDNITSHKSFSLLDYIYYRARQATNKIKEQGYFTISINSINNHLGQPSPKETPKHTEKIIDPILNAITEIEDKQLELKKENIKITPYYEEGKAREFLKGYLKIELDPEANNYFIERATQQEKKIKKAVKKAEKAKERERKKVESKEHQQESIKNAKNEEKTEIKSDT